MAKVFGAGLATALAVCFFIYNLNSCATTEIQETEQYEVYSGLPHIGSIGSIVRLREKRQTQLDLKNEYQSVSQNATETKQTTPPQATNSTEAQSNGTAEHSIVVPYSSGNGSNRPLLGVNGTGQRKDLTDKQVKPTVVADTVSTTTPSSDKKLTQFPKKVLGKELAATPIDSDDAKVIDNFDVSDNETISELTKRNLTVNLLSDHHVYYKSSIYINENEANDIWNSIKNTTHNSMLSQSHRRAMTVELSFKFPFYGHPVQNLTVATGGFMYTGEYVHSWLAATQYVAPLMANFDTSLSNDSFVRLNDNGTALTVIWENVALQDRQDAGRFTFSAILYSTGDIMFTYFKVPIPIKSIHDDKHPVKVGLSDAYIIDKMVNFVRRKTIYEYDRVNFAGVEIRNGTIVRLTALTTCLEYTDCESCINHDTAFHCTWCPGLNRCSSGVDRKKQEWLQKNCDRYMISDAAACPAIGTQGNNSNQTNSSVDPKSPSANTTSTTVNNTNGSNDSSNYVPTPHPNEADSPTITQVNSKPVSSESKLEMENHSEPKSVGLAVGFLVPISLVMTVMLWILYAYRNPHTKSGQLLIQSKNLHQFRPSQWSWRRGEARYTAATIHM